jgi:hypothetical protein
MSRIPDGVESRITHDERTGAIRTWFNSQFRPEAKEGETPEQLARGVLGDSADLFKWKPSLSDIVEDTVVAGPDSNSVRFSQTFKKLSVDSSDIVVNFDAETRLHSIYNDYRYDIPRSLDPASVRLGEKDALGIAREILQSHEELELRGSELVVYQYRYVPNSTGKPGHAEAPRIRVLAAAGARQSDSAERGFIPEPGAYYLAWDIRFTAIAPRGAWRVLVEAVSGHVLNVMDLSQFATGTAEVFDPNPIITSGDTTLRHNSPSATINGQRRPVSLDRLAAPSAGSLHLRGSYVLMQEEESPAVAEPANAGGTFNFNWDDNSFLDAMAYFHLDRFQNYIQDTLGLTNVANYAIPVDPQGFSGVDNSHYVPGGSGTGYVAFGGGLQPIPSYNPIPDAADAMVVLHEYGHAIQDNSNPNFDNPASGVGEGWGDTVAAIYYDDKHVDPGTTRGFMMSWDSEWGLGSWLGRHYDVAWLFDGPEYSNALVTDNHTAGQLWCATMFELYRKLGGDSIYSGTMAGARDLALRLHIMANFNVPQRGATAQQMGQQIEAADNNLGGWRLANGLHRKVIYDTFRRRHLAGYPANAVDVYINDGREGNYGSASQNDLFNERLWLDTWWEVQDVWVKVTPYPDAASQQAGDPGDHVEPAVGGTAYLYVRVKNKGTDLAGSGPVTVRAYHADPGIGLTWPEDWTPMDTPSITVPNILPGSANRVVVGPFPWAPTVVAHECVLAIVECAGDHALTQDLLAADHVKDGDFVPFDNNIAQRNLAPTPAKNGGKRRFTIRNPFDTPKVMELRATSQLPPDWRWHLSAPGEIHLEPRERRWVEITIERADGNEVTNFDQIHELQLIGIIDDEVIGGMTFYLAPPSAFLGPRPQDHHRVRDLEEMLELNIPWKECDFEGEIDIRMRFRKG